MEQVVETRKLLLQKGLLVEKVIAFWACSVGKEFPQVGETNTKQSLHPASGSLSWPSKRAYRSLCPILDQWSVSPRATLLPNNHSLPSSPLQPFKTASTLQGEWPLVRDSPSFLLQTHKHTFITVFLIFMRRNSQPGPPTLLPAAACLPCSKTGF